MAYEVRLNTPVVVTEAELDAPYTTEDVREAAIAQLIELLQRVQDDKHGAQITLHILEV